TSGSGSGTMDVGGLANLTYLGVLANNGAGTGGLTKSRYGTLILGGANTYTGPTVIQDGTIRLDFSQATAPANNIINQNSSLTLGGVPQGLNQTNITALVMNGKNSVVNTQTFNNTTITLGPTVVAGTNGAGGSIVLNLNTITQNTNSTVAFLRPSAGNFKTANANVNGIIGAWATISDGLMQPTNNGTVSIPGSILASTNWATVDGTGNIVNYTNWMIWNDASVGNLAGQVTGDTNLLVAVSANKVVRIDAENAGSTVELNTILLPVGAPGAITFSIGTNN